MGGDRLSQGTMVIVMEDGYAGSQAGTARSQWASQRDAWIEF